MFTGIITHIAPIIKQNKTTEGLELTYAKPNEWTDLEPGESVSTDGVCLSVTSVSESEYSTFLMPETLAKTSFGQSIPKKVNLERALVAGDRFGGHFVQGHVDAIGTVSTIDVSDGYRLFITFDRAFENLVIYKGSITINGVSLTVASIEGNELSVGLIPHTLEHTTLGSLKQGTIVNLEFDVIGKYVTKMMQGNMKGKG